MQINKTTIYNLLSKTKYLVFIVLLCFLLVGFFTLLGKYTKIDVLSSFKNRLQNFNLAKVSDFGNNLLSSNFITNIKNRLQGLKIGKTVNTKETTMSGDSTATEESSASSNTVFDFLAKPDVGVPTHISIAGTNINADIVMVGKSADGFMETPKSWNQAGWFTFSSKTTEEGNIIINGHFDDNYGKPAAFWQLKNVRVGDKVTVVDEFNRPFDYKATEIYYLAINDPDRFKIFNYKKGSQTLTLITCGGVWVPSQSNYNKRLIIRAERVD